jgi:hypothetical protein
MTLSRRHNLHWGPPSLHYVPWNLLVGRTGRSSHQVRGRDTLSLRGYGLSCLPNAAPEYVAGRPPLYYFVSLYLIKCREGFTCFFYSETLVRLLWINRVNEDPILLLCAKSHFVLKVDILYFKLTRKFCCSRHKFRRRRTLPYRKSHWLAKRDAKQRLAAGFRRRTCNRYIVSWRKGWIDRHCEIC